jgi:TRAP-type C4-dicarboxylate transport system permease small subunit
MKLDKIDKKLDNVSRLALFKVARIAFVAGGFVICVMVGVSVVGVFGRLSPLAGAWLMSGYEITMLCLTLVVALAGAYVWYVRGHVRVGLIRDRPSFGQRPRAILDAIASGVFLFWVLGMSIGGVRMVSRSLSVGLATLTSRIPLSPFQIVFVALLIHFALVLLRSAGISISKAAGRKLDRDLY